MANTAAELKISVQVDLGQATMQMKKLESVIDTLGKEGKVDLEKLIREFDKLKAEAKKPIPTPGGTGAGGGIFGGISKGLGTFAIATAAIAGVGASLAKFVAASNEAEMFSVKLNQALISTGRAGEFSRNELDKFAQKMQETTIIEGDQVTQAQALLLTYGQISKETFPDVLSLAGDMSVMLGTDLASSTKILGKALSDPILGMNLLKKQGVVLTESQQAQIKSFVALGDVTKAQGILMDALSQKYSGQASAALDSYGGRMKQFENYFGDLQESIGDFVKVALDEIVKTLLPMIQNLTTFLTENKEIISDVFATIGAVISYVINSIVGQITGFKKIWEGVFDAIGATVFSLWNIMKEVFSGIGNLFSGVGKIMGKVLTGDFEGLKDVAKDLVNDVKGSMAKIGEIDKQGGKDIQDGLKKALEGGMEATGIEAAGKLYDSLRKTWTTKAEEKPLPSPILTTGGEEEGGNGAIADNSKALEEQNKKDLDEYIAFMKVQSDLQEENYKNEQEFLKNKEELWKEYNQSIFDAIQSGTQPLADALSNAILGVEGLKQAFQNAIKSIVSSLTKLAINSVFKYLIQIALGGSTGGLGSIILGGLGIGAAPTVSSFVPDTGFNVPEPVGLRRAMANNVTINQNIGIVAGERQQAQELERKALERAKRDNDFLTK